MKEKDAIAYRDMLKTAFTGCVYFVIEEHRSKALISEQTPASFDQVCRDIAVGEFLDPIAVIALDVNKSSGRDVSREAALWIADWIAGNSDSLEEPIWTNKFCDLDWPDWKERAEAQFTVERELRDELEYNARLGRRY